jgi:hypothetical protein
MIAINEPLVANLKSTAKVARHTGAALLLTELDTLFYILSMANHYDTIQTTSSNILRSI